MRAIIRRQQHIAAAVIQRLARLKLARMRIVKNQAAHKIQKAWRRKLFIRTALMRMFLDIARLI